jgi:nudix-type nucleoside diphosphatase (YffH/AdpP family)
MEKIKVLSETRAFDSYFKVDRALVSHDKGDGTTETYSRYKLTRPDAVAVLILNEDTEKVTLVKQFRYAIADREPNGVLEIVAGKMDEGETPEQSAIREVMEEVGYEISLDCLSVPTITYASPGYSSEKFYTYIAVVNNKMKVASGGGLETEHESIEIVEIDVQKFMEMARDGQINDSKTLIAAHNLFLQSIETILESGFSIKTK